MPEIVPRDRPDNPPVALILIDVINDFDFAEGKALRDHAEAVIEPLLDLRQRCRDRGIPVIYANDNFGAWRSDFAQVLDHYRREDSLGRLISTALAPSDGHYIVLKPKHSAFFGTTLELLLRHLGIETLILTGAWPATSASSSPPTTPTCATCR